MTLPFLHRFLATASYQDRNACSRPDQFLSEEVCSPSLTDFHSDKIGYGNRGFTTSETQLSCGLNANHIDKVLVRQKRARQTA